MTTPVPFDRYLAAVRAADPADYPAVTTAEFERMRDYLLRFYAGVRPAGGHVEPSGATIDYVPFDQFPTVRAARAAGVEVGQTAPRPSDTDTHPAGEALPAAAAHPLHPSHPAGTIPVARMSLDVLVRAGSLARFLAPPGKGAPPAEDSAGPARPGG